MLANMKGQAEPLFEYDFPPGPDMIGEIMDCTKAGGRIEFELFVPLAESAKAT